MGCVWVGVGVGICVLKVKVSKVKISVMESCIVVVKVDFWLVIYIRLWDKNIGRVKRLAVNFVIFYLVWLEFCIFVLNLFENDCLIYFCFYCCFVFC